MLPTAALVAALVSEQRVSAWAYGCNFAATKTVTVFAQNQSLFGAKGRTATVGAQADSHGRLHFIFTLPPGSFRILYMADGQRCSSGGEGLAILRGHDRRIVVSMLPGMWIMDWHARRFFAGALPSVGLAVSVVMARSSECPTDEDVHDSATREYPAVIDGGAYYVGYASGLHAFLRVRSAGFEVLYLALPDEPLPRQNNQYVVRDITSDDLKRLAAPANPNRPVCVMEPSGSSTRFNL